MTCKTNMGKIQIWIFILLLANQGGTASVTEVHNSTSVTAGESIRLACSKSFNSLVSWQHIPRGNKNRVTISENNDISKKYEEEHRFSLEVDAASGKYDLLISDVQLSDAGIYYCTNRMLETSVDLTVQKRLRNLVVAPVSSTAFVGKEARLNCSTSYQDFVYWQHTPYGASSTLDVFAGVFNEPYASNHRYRIEQDAVSGQYDLVISDVQFSDAGRFSCTDNRGFGSRVMVELVVLGVPMLCKTTADEEGIVVENDCGVKTDILNITCVTSYAGNVVPRLRLRHGDLTFDNASTHIETVHQNSVSIISSFEIQPTYHMTDNSMTCELVELPNVPEGDLCSLSKLNIKYFYNSTWILSQTSVYRHTTETKISCMANSSESCSYKWYESNNPSKILSHDQQFDSRHGRFQCLAECTLRGTTCSSTSQPVVLDMKKPESNISGILLGYSWTAVGTLFIILIIVYWKRRWFATKLTMLSRNPLTDTVPLMFQGNIEYRKVCMQRVSVITRLQSREKPKNLNNSNNNNERNKFQSCISFLYAMFDQSAKVKDDNTQEPLSGQEFTTNEVRGLAILGNNIYIVRANERTIEEYNSETYAYIKSIFVEYLPMVRDMVSCSRYKRLYICDEDNNIHRIRIPRFQNNIDMRQIESWSMPHKPESMSVTPDGDLVVTYFASPKIIIYSSKGSSKREVIPPGNPWHSLQLMNDRFVIFHTSAGANPAANTISLVSDKSESGRLICPFEGDGSYDLGKGRLAATTSEFIFATDYKNSRVLLLDPELKLVDGSIISEIQHPSRICFDEQRQRMYVAVENNTKDVYVYKLFPKSDIWNV